MGELLEVACDGIGYVLHDRKLPGSKRNIDHVVVTGAGVFVVDAKNVAGVPKLADYGGSLTTDARLRLGNADRTMWVEGVQSLSAAVREVAGVNVVSILCFVDQSSPLYFTVRGVEVVDESTLPGIVRRQGPLTPVLVNDIAGRLASALRAAR